MTETVVSKFNYSLFVGIGLITLFLSPMVYVGITIGTQSWLMDFILILLMYFFIKRTIDTLVKITVAADGLELKYLITGKKVIVNYSDITHVDNKGVTGMYNFSNSPSYVKLDVELTNGKKITILGDNYSNYDEIREAIRRNRFHLDG